MPTDHSPSPSSRPVLSMSPTFATSPPTSTVQWIPNHLAARCLSCYDDFSFLKRRHHCRRCGMIFCEQCSSKRAQLQPRTEPVRVCDKCYSAVRQVAAASARQSPTAIPSAHTKHNPTTPSHQHSNGTHHSRLPHSATTHSLTSQHHPLTARSTPSASQRSHHTADTYHSQSTQSYRRRTVLDHTLSYRRCGTHQIALG